MKETIFPVFILCGFVGLLIFMVHTPVNFETTIHYKRIFSTGFADSSIATIETTDSAKYQVFYHSPEKYFPTGAFYFANQHSDAHTNRDYVLPQVVKVEPYLVYSKRL